MRSSLPQQARQILAAALERPPSARAAFVAAACAADHELRRAVEALLSAELRAAKRAVSSSAIEGGYCVPLNQPNDPADQEHDQTPPPTLPPQKLNNRYLLERELDRGGIGVVYLARDEHLHGKRVVVKFLLDAPLPPDDLAWLRSHFELEKEALARINHPSVVGILEAGEWASRPFLVMEYVNGETLRAIISRGQLSLTRAAEIVRQIGSALAAAHDNHIFHRDLKPANVMLQDLGGGDERVKLIDFGIATVRHSQVVHSHEHTKIVGTLPYMAPEQMLGQPSAASDIYALGVIAYELLTGRVPFEADSHIALYNLQGRGAFIRPAVLRPELPAAAEAVIVKALAFTEAERYQRANEFGEELHRALTILSPTQALPASVAPTQFEHPPLAAAADLVGLRVMILYKRHAQPDEHLVKLLEAQLSAQGCQVFIDRHLPVGTEWAQEIERQLRGADVVIPLLSAASVNSEMLAYEVQIAYEAAQQQHGKPRLLPVRVEFSDALPEPLGAILNPIQYALWTGPQDDDPLITDLVTSALTPVAPRPTAPVHQPEQPGGAVPLDSHYYIIRPTDEEFLKAVARRDSIVLVKGARQMGKTSLLARGLQLAREGGAQVVLTDFQMLDAAHLVSIDALFLALAEAIAERLELNVDPNEQWNPRSGANVNFARFLRREVLGRLQTHLVWGLDEVDRLFSCEFGSQVFALFRSWHNARALDPVAPWQRLTLAIAYATEAHLFITDINQSPFNVGTRLALDDFTVEQVAELNHRHGFPLRDKAEVTRFYHLVGGQPYLVRRGLHQMATQPANLATFAEQADRDEGPLGDHLRRMLFVLARQPTLCESVREVLRGRPCPSAEHFYRLRSAGVMSGDAAQEAKLRCQLYASYLKRHLL